jgi:hypothetical protein
MGVGAEDAQDGSDIGELEIDGDIKLGVVLPPDAMNAFASCFAHALGATI